MESWIGLARSHDMERAPRILRGRIETRAVDRAAEAFLHAPGDCRC